MCGVADDRKDQQAKIIDAFFNPALLKLSQRSPDFTLRDKGAGGSLGGQGLASPEKPTEQGESELDGYVVSWDR